MEGEDTIRINAVVTIVETIDMIMIMVPLQKDRQAMVVGKIGGIDRRIKKFVNLLKRKSSINLENSPNVKNIKLCETYEYM